MFILFFLFLVLGTFSVKSDGGFIYPNLYFNYLSSQLDSPVLIMLINQILLALGMVLVGYIVSNEEITEKQNYLPVIIYFFIGSAGIYRNQISIFLLNNLFILFAILKFLSTYRKDSALSELFIACFWLSISFYFNSGNIFIIPFIFIAMVIYRPFIWKEYLICMLGLIIPIYMYEMLAYTFEFNQWYFFESLATLFNKFRQPVFKINFLPFLSSLILLFIMSIFYFIAQGLGNTVKKQKTKTTFFWMMLCLLPMIFTFGLSYSHILILYAVPVSFLIGEYLFEFNSKKLINISCFVLLITSLFYLLSKTNWLDNILPNF
ncbi:MAG: DUF6427 family protein [Bacteroidia bacterium]